MRILLAVDDSACSAAVTQSITAQFMPQHTHVHVLHVDECPKELQPAHDLRRRNAAALIAAAADDLRAAGFTTAASIRDGDPRHVIVAVAREWHADLIVLGSPARNGFGRLIPGSVSDSVASHASCSVQIVRTAAKVA
jgi:nucleotide-binding universal stress UspA family protein